ncbi:MAG: hypothetical protein DRQ88_11885 [Epsilonproteobacteria bacterium]|nr:MAG: hypothetical protein DRQ88_11885 [Campylobacterota bacterium]RLA65806.1 MAG: hypothetical protein DRQ89_00180 [Campylobacterota bacterium]
MLNLQHLRRYSSLKAKMVKGHFRISNYSKISICNIRKPRFRKSNGLKIYFGGGGGILLKTCNP